MITLHGEVHSSKNSRRILRTRDGRTFVAKSEAAKADEGALLLQLNSQYSEWQQMLNAAGRVFPLRVVFFFRRATKRRFDYVNLAQGVLDAMVAAEYLPDDCADYVIPVFMPYQVDKQSPGVNIWIEKGK